LHGSHVVDASHCFYRSPRLGAREVNRRYGCDFASIE